MEKKDILLRLTEIFKRVFKDNSLSISEESTANDIDQWDSLSHMILITEVEQAFAIKFKLKDLNKMRNVGDMMDIIILKSN
jgi:acyl carrier protein